MIAPDYLLQVSSSHQNLPPEQMVGKPVLVLWVALPISSQQCYLLMRLLLLLPTWELPSLSMLCWAWLLPRHLPCSVLFSHPVNTVVNFWSFLCPLSKFHFLLPWSFSFSGPHRGSFLWVMLPRSTILFKTCLLSSLVLTNTHITWEIHVRPLCAKQTFDKLHIT